MYGFVYGQLQLQHTHPYFHLKDKTIDCISAVQLHHVHPYFHLKDKTIDCISAVQLHHAHPYFHLKDKTIDWSLQNLGSCKCLKLVRKHSRGIEPSQAQWDQGKRERERERERERDMRKESFKCALPRSRWINIFQMDSTAIFYKKKRRRKKEEASVHFN